MIEFIVDVLAGLFAGAGVLLLMVFPFILALIIVMCAGLLSINYDILLLLIGLALIFTVIQNLILGRGLKVEEKYL